MSEAIFEIISIHVTRLPTFKNTPNQYMANLNAFILQFRLYSIHIQPSISFYEIISDVLLAEVPDIHKEWC